MSRTRRPPPSLLLAATLASLLGAADARAITSCAFTGVSGLSFGDYDVFDPAPRDTTGSIVIRCDDVGASDTVYVDLAGASPRRMLGPDGAHLDYDVYLDAIHTIAWGDGSGGTSHLGPVVPPDGTDWTLPAYGRVPARQNVPVGAYGDTVVITIHF